MGVMLAVIARGLFLACVPSGFGAALSAVALMKPVVQGLDAKARGLIEGRVRSVMRLSLAAALPIGLAWLALEAKVMSGAKTLADTVAAIPEVLLHMSFGHVLALQGLAIAGALTAIATHALAEPLGARSRRSCRAARSWPQPWFRHG